MEMGIDNVITVKILPFNTMKSSDTLFFSLSLKFGYNSIAKSSNLGLFFLEKITDIFRYFAWFNFGRLRKMHFL